MTDAVPWELYRSFLAVARHGSLSGAARALRLTQPTLGRHVDLLEQALGTPMFTRSPQGLIATDTARALVPIAEAMESAAEAMTRTASGHPGDIAGVVRITASEVVGAEVLPEILAAFAEHYPKIAFELHLSNRREDLLRRDADIAVRMVRPTQEALVARRVGGIEVGLHAHRRYLDGRRAPRTLQDLAGHALVGWDTETAYIRKLSDQYPQISRDRFAFRCDSDVAQLAAIRAGVGIGFCQAGLAARDPGMVRVLKSSFTLTLDTWVAMHADLRDSPRCATTFAALASGLKAYIQGSHSALPRI